MITIDSSKLLKSIDKMTKDQMPFALSQALRDTVTEGSRQAALGAKRFLEDPTPQMTRGSEKGDKRRGVFRHAWDSKKQIQAKGVDNAEGRVFVINPLLHELSNIVFGLTAKNVPEGGNAVMTPTRAVLKGLAGRGRLRKLNKYGNIPGLLAGALKRAKDDTEFLNVPLHTRATNTKHLHPGLYIRVFKDARVRRARSAARSRGLSTNRSRGDGGRFSSTGGAETTLVMLIAYENQARKYKRWFKYDQIVQRSMSEEFGENFAKRYNEALKTAFK